MKEKKQRVEIVFNEWRKWS